MNTILNKMIILIILSMLAFSITQSKENHSHKCGLSLMLNPDTRDNLLREIILNNDVPTVGQKNFISKNNLFKIHYDTVGYNAPSLVDINKNGVPDYIDSVAFYFETAYQVLTHQRLQT